jgi:hypothetical protein
VGCGGMDWIGLASLTSVTSYKPVSFSRTTLLHGVRNSGELVALPYAERGRRAVVTGDGVP